MLNLRILTFLSIAAWLEISLIILDKKIKKKTKTIEDLEKTFLIRFFIKIPCLNGYTGYNIIENKNL